MNKSGPPLKKARISSKVETTSQKSLLDMPEEIIDVILQFSELVDQKSLSESCKRLNTIFGQRRNLKNVWLVVKDQTDIEKRALSNSTRSYKNLYWDAPMPIAVWKNLSLTLTQLNINFGADLCPSIISALPYFTELTHFAFANEDTMLFMKETKNQLKQLKNIKPVVLQKLRHLKVTYGFMQNFFNRFIQIDSENLQTFVFYGDNPDELLHINGQHNCYNDIRELIARQKNLRTLRLEVTKEFFDRPFVINCQLRKLFGFGSSIQEIEFTHQQESNLCDFLLSQNEFECVVINCIMKNPSARLSQWVQHLKLKRNFLSIVNKDYSIFCLGDVTFEELQHHQQMPSVEELTVECIDMPLTPDQIQTLFSQFTTKFPNVTIMRISTTDSTNLALVNSLDSIKELTYSGDRDWSLLKSSTISNIECFIFELTLNDISRLNREKANVIDFLIRQQTLKRIKIEILNGMSYVRMSNATENEIVLIQCLTDIIGAVLMHLSDLRMFSVHLLFDQKQIWKHDFDSHCGIHALITERANSGFVFRYSNEYEVLKRDDNKLVRRNCGRWADSKQ